MKSEKKTAAILNDRALMVACLHYRGSCNRMMNEIQREAAWVAGDGYGAMSRDQLIELDLVEDWSHLRDSSTAGVAQIALVIREAIGSRRLLVAQKIVAQLGTTTDEVVR